MASISPTYSSAFPALYSASLTDNPRRTCTHQQGGSTAFLPPTMHRCLAPPKYPSYLKQTLYGSLVLEQYNFDQRKHKTSVNGRSNSSISSGTQHQQPLPKTSTLEDEQMEQLDLRLPTFWNQKDKSRNIEVGNNGLDLSYIGKMRMTKKKNKFA